MSRRRSLAGMMSRLMAVASEEAAAGAAQGGEPVGAALSDAEGRVLSVGRNEVVQRGDITAHAELMAVRGVAGPLDWSHTVLATTAEPCWLCSGLILRLGIPRVAIGSLVDGWTAAALRDHGVDVVHLPDRERERVVEEYYRYRDAAAPLRRDVRPASFDADRSSDLTDPDARFARWRRLHPYGWVEVPADAVALLTIEGTTCAPGYAGAATGEASERAPERATVVAASLARLGGLARDRGIAHHRFVHGAPAGESDAVCHESANAFASGPLRGRLSEAGVRTLVVAGHPMSCCVEGTVRGARDLGLTAYVVADAVWDVEHSVAAHSLYAVARLFGRVCHVDDVARSWAPAADERPEQDADRGAPVRAVKGRDR